MAHAFPAGPMTEASRCLICTIGYRPGQHWHWWASQPAVSETYIFAGYFCSERCLMVWRRANDDRRSELIFGDAGGLRRLRERFRVRDAEGRPLMVRETTPDEAGVPVFEPDGDGRVRFVQYRAARATQEWW